MSSTPIICSNPGCNIREDGKCIEGLTKENCPNYGNLPAPETSDEAEAALAEPTALNLAPSVVLKAEAASRVLAARASRVVAVIATSDAGKTSLIAAIYDAFQRNPLAGMRFAGSSTLHSFELTCHDSRSASKREEAAIFRTPLGESRFYHLDLCPQADSEVLSLLIADRAGEEYLMVSADIANAEPLFEVRRADTLTILVDGERLVDPVNRHNVRAEIEGIVQGLSDANALNGRQRLAIALTKNDAVQNSTRSEIAKRDLVRLVDSICIKHGSRFAEIETFITTASPKKPNATRGEGLSELLEYWLKPLVIPTIAPIFIDGTRDFDRLCEVES